ncbi:ras-like GTP-binding protein RhoL isoform X1 [Bradysia coprophila]|uniref:ras-like GTP-binding protein RhoL isoform X1 n=1 Tax=Bradysia coprophila TaxID=38358 RepID=UPI00187D9FD7|nr:ras-like GTP-binding protein RhoL isoform X1 [Bradysia coprophila]
MNNIINLVIVGDSTVGKTCLLFAYTNKGGFNSLYEPTIYEREESELVLDGQRYFIKLHDTAGQEDFDRLRLVIYKDTDVFILCYSMDNRTSFENIFSKWYPELLPYNKPIILVGTKSDIQGPNIIKVDEAEILRRKIRASALLMCSAKDYHNINEVIYTAVRAINEELPPQEEDSSTFSCCNCF